MRQADMFAALHNALHVCCHTNESFVCFGDSTYYAELMKQECAMIRVVNMARIDFIPYTEDYDCIAMQDMREMHQIMMNELMHFAVQIEAHNIPFNCEKIESKSE